ncbi:nucleoside triphosphate pyrophosphatase [Rivularia sp. UHCC 0363]|uniref:Maf family protein n=1 Tax=Rivularia sp. UHCC 0363 TaxID=3110244 RepID=UPI002B1F562C|nr:nucleoside triphosphate pyrophosphatase [Rivularia sp. UHCC 0363]MEA5599288.1 nucleoside triphosphate pyrophosphatase [Rivularia sp. UHCC 0363]
MGTPTFVLASASTARRRLLQNVGIQPFVCASDFDESQVQIENPAELVQTLALRKAQTVAPNFQSALVMGCDSVLAINGEIHGKPANQEEARQRWLMMRGNYGELFTGHVFIDNLQKQNLVKYQVTKVYFTSASLAEIDAYVATEEPLKCAGAFALEGKGSVFVEKIEGCYSNVVGLSLPLLRLMLAEMGYSIADFWN